MLEDAITSSPSNSNKSIHETRLIRRNKRKKAEGIFPINSDHQEQNIGRAITIYDFYKDSEESADANESKDSTFIVAKPSAIIENYKPFEMEKSLAIADHILTHQNIKENNTNMWPVTQGFLSCLNLTQLVREKPCISLSITESELISCCHNAEKILQNDDANSSVQELTPKKKDDMFLVNSILNDFSQSPLSADQSRTTTCHQYTPEFRLRRQPIKTYSRKFLNTTKTNLNNRFEEQATAVSEDDDQSLCSSLSIQEDVTVIELSNNYHPASTNTSNTQRLCENLLNLSVYFSQNNQTHSNLSDESQFDSNASCSLDNDQNSPLFLSNIPELIKDIITLRSNSNKSYDSFNSLDDFQGFHSHKDDDKDVIDMDSTEVDIMQTTLTHDFKIDNNPVLETSLCGEDIWNENDCHDIFAGINTENILPQKNAKNSNNIQEIAAEFTTTLAPKNSETFTVPVNSNHDHMLPKSIGFKTASSKSITVSRNAHIMAAKILSQLPEIPELPKLSEPKNCDTKDGDIFENPENYEWNDDCDLFLNFQTPIVLKEKPTIEPKQQLNINEVQIPFGFKTAGGTNVHITKKAQETVQKLLNEFKNSENKDNFNCEEELKELKCKIYAKTHNIESKPSSLNDVKENNNTKKLQLSQQLQVAPSTSKMTSVGFKTAGGKNVQISKKAQETVQKLLNEFTNPKDNYNCEEELKELKCKVYAKTHNTKSKLSSSVNTKDIKSLNGLQDTQDAQVVPSTSKGFKTAGGKDVHVSKKAQETVQKLINEFSNCVPKDNYNCEEELRELKCKVYAKTHNSESKTSSSDNNKDIKSLNELQDAQEIEVFPSTSKVALCGFKTAGGKNVHISKKAQDTVQKLLNEFTNCDPKDNLNCEEELKELKCKVYNKMHNFESNSKNIEFHTNNDNKPPIFMETQQNEKMLNEVCREIEQNFENNMENMNIEDNKHVTENEEYLNDIILSEWPLAKTHVPEIQKNENLTTTMENRCDTSKGFQNANGKQITISTKAQRTVEKHLKEFNKDFDIEMYENDLIEMKTKMQIKNKELLHNSSNSIKPKTSKTNNDNADTSFSEWPTNCNSSTPKPTNCKRKHSIDNSDIPSPGSSSSPPAKVFNKDLSNSKSLFAEQSLKSPLTTHSLIGRKNLLSLTKRRTKRNSLTMRNEEFPKIHKEKYDLNVNAATPIKTSVSLVINAQTPATPNLKEFISNAELTSTPRLNITSESPQTIKDTDFKPINWRNNPNDSINSKSNNSKSNTSNHTTKLSENSTLNITLNSSNPTAQERIGRLKMYGKAPAVSPILIETNHNCRPSGLRRSTRSMLKKTEK